MSLEDLADLIRANSPDTNLRIDELRDDMVERIGETNRRIDALPAMSDEHVDRVMGRIGETLREDRNDTDAKLMTMQNDMTEIRHALSVADTVVEMRKRIEALEAEVARLGRSA